MKPMSIYDLVHEYIILFYPHKRLLKENKQAIHREIKALLNRGWCAADLLAGFQAAHRADRAPTFQVQSLFRGKRSPNENLIKQGIFYYHNELRLTSPPPKREVDYDSGTIKTINEPYFLEMKASYTIEDLVRYYARQTGLRLRDHEVGRYIGSMKWLLKSHEIEAILFMIDVTVNMCQSEDMPMPQSPLDIQKYAGDARITRSQKVTETMVAGGKCIVRKSRTKSSRVRN